MMRSTIAVVLLTTISLSGCINTDNGYGHETDKISNFQLEGMWWKTWTVYMLNDHPNQDSCECFGVEHNEALVDQLNALSLDHSRPTVTIYFHKLWAYWPQDYSNGDIIYKVEVLSQ